MKHYDVVIIGAGPAGIFTALELYKHAPETLRVLVVDEGINIEHRRCPARKHGVCVRCNPCNIMSGWAGAGAFSDGKLSLSEEVGGNLVNYLPVDEVRTLIHYADLMYLDFGAPKEVFGLNDKKSDEIAYECSKYNIHLVRCPVRHMGTEYSYEVLKAMYDHLMKISGFTFLERTHADPIIDQKGIVTGVRLTDKDGNAEDASAHYVVAAPGRGGAEWLAGIAHEHDISTCNNEVDIGVRVEVPAEVFKHITDEVYEAKILYRTSLYNDVVRTFCMNPYGYVVAENTDGIITVNGHSYRDPKMHSKNTNFALLVSSKFTEPFHEPLQYGKRIASFSNMLGGGVLVQRFGDLVKGRRTNEKRMLKSFTKPTLSATPGDLSLVLPKRHLDDIIEMIYALDKIAPGMANADTLLYGVEVKFYSARLELDSNLETKVANMFAVGDGAGITRGLSQASASGVWAARVIGARACGQKN